MSTKILEARYVSPRVLSDRIQSDEPARPMTSNVVRHNQLFMSTMRPLSPFWLSSDGVVWASFDSFDRVSRNSTAFEKKMGWRARRERFENAGLMIFRWRRCCSPSATKRPKEAGAVNTTPSERALKRAHHHRQAEKPGVLTAMVWGTDQQHDRGCN